MPRSLKGKEVQGEVSATGEGDKAEDWKEGTKGWEPPREGWIKVNVDGSFVEQTGEAGVGVIARNWQGEVIFSAWRVIFRCASALEAEALSCVEGLRLATQWAQEPVVLEMDCKCVVEAMKSGEGRSEVSFLIMEVKELTELIVNWEVVQVKRECNVIAHELAHLARRNCHSAVWLGREPACVIDQVKFECNSLLMPS
nr:unnamed protein product [Digitaria exilis]